jgi:hypothetical protein
VSQVVYGARGIISMFSVVAASLCAAACGGGPGSLGDGIGDEGPVSSSASSSSQGSNGSGQLGACETPEQGCACATAGETADCLGPKVRTGDYTSCAPGERVCSGGVWGACSGKTVIQGADAVTQDYSLSCSSGTHPVWGALALEGVIPGNSQVDVSVQTASTEAALDAAAPATLAEFSGANESSWTSAAVSSALAKLGQSSGIWLRVTFTITVASEGGQAPMLVGWQQASSCASGG